MMVFAGGVGNRGLQDDVADRHALLPWQVTLKLAAVAQLKCANKASDIQSGKDDALPEVGAWKGAGGQNRTGPHCAKVYDTAVITFNCDLRKTLDSGLV